MISESTLKEWKEEADDVFGSAQFPNHKIVGNEAIYSERILALIDELELLKKESLELTEFYANETNYDRSVDRHGYLDSSEWTQESSDIDSDSGDKARKFLEKWGRE